MPRWVRPLVLALAILNLLLIAINVLGAPSFLDFDQEANFTTWYSSGKLFLTAIAALWCARLEPAADRPRTRRYWTLLGVIFFALSMDETATAHERLAGWIMHGPLAAALRTRFLGGDAAKDAFLWPVLLSPAVVAVLYFLVTFLWGRLRHHRLALGLGLAGCVLFAAAVVLEGPAVYTSPPVDTWGAVEIARYRLFSEWEESAEAVGATLMLAALLEHARRMAGATTSVPAAPPAGE